MTLATNRDLTRHALSLAFSEATTSDFQELVRSIQERGYDRRHPILLFEGQILDGWHRWKACKDLDVSPTFENFEGTETEARQIVFAENIARRQMSQAQKSMAYLVRNQWLAPREQLSDAEIAARTGKQSLTKVSQLRRISTDNPEIAHQVAAGDYPGGANRAIRDTLQEEPADDKRYDEKGVFTITDKRRLERISAARRSIGWTPTKMTNKAFDLFIEWVEKGGC